MSNKTRMAMWVSDRLLVWAAGAVLMGDVGKGFVLLGMVVAISRIITEEVKDVERESV